MSVNWRERTIGYGSKRFLLTIFLNNSRAHGPGRIPRNDALKYPPYYYFQSYRPPKTILLSGYVGARHNGCSGNGERRCFVAPNTRAKRNAGRTSHNGRENARVDSTGGFDFGTVPAAWCRRCRNVVTRVVGFASVYSADSAGTAYERNVNEIDG